MIHKARTKALSLLLSLSLVLGLMPGMSLTAYADNTIGNYVAEVVNGSKYETLKDAIDNATTGDTVKLLADIVTSDTIYIRNKQDLTLDLNGLVLCQDLAQNKMRNFSP